MAQFEDIQESMGGLDPLDGPQPGESLVASPEQKLPFEQPPQFTDMDTALEELFMNITDDENLDRTIGLIRAEMPLEDIAQVILFSGFRDGIFTPDLMLLLIEPTIYILIFLADYANIDPVLYPEDEFDFAEEGESSAKDFEDIPVPASIPNGLLDTIKEKIGAQQETKPDAPIAPEES